MTTRARVFGVSAAATAVGLFGIGWLTGAREVMYGALLSCLIAATLPFLIIAGGFALIVMTLVVAAFTGEAPDGIDGGARMIASGTRFAPRYYAFLARRRHPGLWGGAVGVLLGGLALWGAFAIFVLPGETRTAEQLELARARIQLHYAEHGALPAPDANHHLTLDGVVVEDGFGQPLEYRVQGVRKLASWQLRSPGYDGEPSRDDLCMAGGTPIVERALATAQLLQLSKRTRSLGERLEGLGGLRCAR